MKLLRSLMVVCGLLINAFPVLAAEKLHVKDAWVPEAPPVASVMAAYLVIENSGDKPVTITDMSSSDFGMVMMHKTITKDGMSRMVHQDSVTVAAKSQVAFERGGLHVMLMEPKHNFKVGDKISLTLHTQDKQTVQFSAVVKPATLGDDDQHQHHHH